MKNKTMSVFIGRFQPAHMGHLHIIEEALKQTDELLILIGSSFKPPSAKNPFSYDERVILIRQLLSENGISEAGISFVPIQDHMYNDVAWAAEVTDIVNDCGYLDEDIRLIGHEKDYSSFYLKMFPQWKSISVDNYQDLNSTDLRDDMYNESFSFDPCGYNAYFGNSVASKKMIEIIFKSDNFKTAKDEFHFIQEYKKSWELAPFPPTFITVDALVECSNHIIVIKRGGNPGIGLLALPGGFLDGGSILDNAIRELREETCLKVPVPVLKGSLKSVTVFDHPDRSQRGRTVTHCHHFKLRDELKLPKIQGGDDAKDAFWMPISEVKHMSDEFFEDHYDMIMKQLGL